MRTSCKKPPHENGYSTKSNARSHEGNHKSKHKRIQINKSYVFHILCSNVLFFTSSILAYLFAMKGSIFLSQPLRLAPRKIIFLDIICPSCCVNERVNLNDQNAQILHSHFLQGNFAINLYYIDVHTDIFLDYKSLSRKIKNPGKVFNHKKEAESDGLFYSFL